MTSQERRARLAELNARSAEEFGLRPDDIGGICRARATLADGRGRRDLAERWRAVGERHAAYVRRCSVGAAKPITTEEPS